MPRLPMPSPFKHPKTGVYWLRLRVPADVQASLGRKELKRSLGTKDPDIAKVRFPDALKAAQEEFRRHREGPVPLSPRDISGLAGEHYRELAALGGRAFDGRTWEQLARVSESHAKAGSLGRWHGPTADELLRKVGVLPDEESRQRLVQALHEALVKAAETNVKAAAGDFSPDENLKRFAPMPAKKPETVTLTSLRELWEREHKAAGGSERTRRDWGRMVETFAAYLGHDDAERVAPKDVTGFADHLRHDRGLKAKTINGRYLAALGSLYRLGMAKHVIAANPAHGAEVSPEKVTRTRSKGFTSDEAEAVLKAALGEAEARSEVSMARRWIPWIAAYSGCRVGEIVQLRREDFMTDGGIPYFRVTPEAGSVKTGEYRPVPIHPHLVELGLLDFVDRTKEGRIFTAKDAPRIVTRFVRKALNLPEGRTIMPNHAWRHRLKTMGREYGVDLRALDALQGHSTGTEGERYGEWTVAALYRELTKLPRYEASEAKLPEEKGESRQSLGGSAVSSMDGDTGWSEAVKD